MSCYSRPGENISSPEPKFQSLWQRDPSPLASIGVNSPCLGCNLCVSHCRSTPLPVVQASHGGFRCVFDPYTPPAGLILSFEFITELLQNLSLCNQPHPLRLLFPSAVLAAARLPKHQHIHALVARGKTATPESDYKNIAPDTKHATTLAEGGPLRY